MSENKINWNIVFDLQEFLAYNHYDMLKELSLVSKFTRNKLNSRLFNKLEITGFKFKEYFSLSNLDTNQTKLVIDYAEYLYNSWKVFQSEDKCTHQSLNNSRFDSLITELNKAFSGVASYITHFIVSSFVHCFYAFYPITNAFVNLTKLEL
ncbi:hypothetical protein CONCODRAFT_20595 [Conidiobolus coronatus NRRL 28638]|uniref:Uncharacterized protein n=1 Tax=Conidiobolus coronatus (strain ATCC 28846 / CBS 209.66 / NRRL 28638) TaxID=796925 RepID=A0A137NSK0_CONC2|nr:hypothetical protein CONCODRAFT_20595 [Conidiobolus coronatus NRRL 28638]|eukprot:KXN65737.1 hypothetical protein CONCODRAFT_20595 [Conidiobolus coronatus NRRL 28638]